MTRLGEDYLKCIIFLQDKHLSAAFVNISCEVFGFPAGNARAPAGKKTAWSLQHKMNEMKMGLAD